MRFIVHPGYSKTATTFLQEKIFSNLKNTLYLGKNLEGMIDPDLTDIFLKDFFGESSSNYQKKAPIFAKKIVSIINLKKNKKFQNILISIEELQDRDTNVVNKVKKYNTNTDYNLFRLKLLFDELEKLIGSIQIDFLITIREQKAFLQSLYRGSYLDFKKTRFDFFAINTFEKFINEGIKKPYNNWFGSLHYYDEIMKYENFCSGNLKIMLYEDFLKDKIVFCKDLLVFLDEDFFEIDYDIEINKGSNRHQNTIFLNFLIFFNNLIPKKFRLNSDIHIVRIIRKIFSLKIKKPTFNESQIREIDMIYKENNNLLKDKYKLDLNDNNYAL